VKEERISPLGYVDFKRRDAFIDTSVAYRYKCRLYLNFRDIHIRQIFGYIGGSLFITEIFLSLLSKLNKTNTSFRFSVIRRQVPNFPTTVTYSGALTASFLGIESA